MPASKTADTERLQLRLLGTVVANDNALAVCLSPATGATIRLRAGESFEGWVLRSVSGREAAFENKLQRVVLELSSRVDGSTAPSTPQVTSPLVAPEQPQTRTSPVQSAQAQVSAPASGTWIDGDGQMIAPPQRSK